MTNLEWVEMLKVIPKHEHNALVLMTTAGLELTVETIFRFEQAYLVMRGRLAGTNDEGRAFFIPYDQITYLNLNRLVAEKDIREFYGELMEDEPKPLTEDAPPPEPEQSLAATPPLTAPAPAPAPAASAAAGPSAPTPIGRFSSADAAAAAKTVLLERIRAARAGSAPPPPSRSGG
jgi:hypothetical protein